MIKTRQNLIQVFFILLSCFLLNLVGPAYAEPLANDLPTGGQVVSGNASITSTGATLNVNQTSQRAIVNWDSFNVGKDATVNFNQPNSSASTLNRISSGTPSQIYGKINAIGEVILQNTAGVYFSKSASLDVGSIAATTHTISNDDYNNGRYHFDRNGSTGSVINEGNIKAGLNGYVALLAPEVRNSGVIVAQMGTVVMAAGERVTLNFDTNSHLASITTTPATINSLIENKSAVTVNGGTIILSAKAVNSLVSGVIKQSGSLDASNVVNKVVSVGGRIMIDGDDVNIAANSETLAHGSVGGGQVAISASRSLTTEATSKINVSAIESGNGGSIKTTAASTSFAGDMMALGGTSSGKGGVIETNADNLILANTASVNANNQDGMSDKGTWTINLPHFTMTHTIAEVISTTLNTTNVNLNLLASSFDLLKDQVIEKIAGAKTLFEINAKTQINILGNISSDASAPLDLILTSYESILVGSSSTINVRNIDAEAPTISVAGNLNAYGNSNQDSSPFMALLGARLAITGNLRSGSKQNPGRIMLKGLNELNIGSSGNISTEGNDGGWIKILSNNGSVNIAGTIMTNGESGRGGTININGSQNVLINSNLLANGTTDGGLVIVASNSGDVNFQQSFIQTNGGAGVGGTILLSGVNNTIISSTEISATGYLQGGSIKVGNDLANQLIPFSSFTEIDSKSVVNASQLNLSAQNNQGGFIETSANTVNLLGSINAGRGGMWLIDPYDITIDSTKAGYIKTVLDAGSSVTITTASASNTVGLNSISGSSGSGDITINAAITSSGVGASLTLTAANDIYVNQAITLSGAGSSITFTATNTNLSSDISTYGNQTFNSNVRLFSGITLTSNGGDVNITGNVVGISGLIEFLGGGVYKYNGTSYTVGVGTSPINVLYTSSTSTYSWQAQSTSAEVLLVAGGGGGGMDMGGGGGGGGVISTTVSTASQTWYQIKVGAGGSGAPAGSTNGQPGDHQYTIRATAGGNSTLQHAGGTLTAIGGGYGGSSYWGYTPDYGYGGAGGSGGGASGYSDGNTGRGGAGTTGQGYAGGGGQGQYYAGGGGGAGGVGGSGRSNGSAYGGIGVENSILGTSYYWGGGGGGASYSVWGGNGGLGGGGGGAVGTTTGGAGYNNGSAGGGGCTGCWANTPGGNAGANTGGGGGGGSHYNANNNGGNGGSGIVVLKYATNNSLTLTANNGRVSLPSDLTLSNINSITIVDGNTNRDLTFNSLTLVNTALDLVNRKLTAASLIMDVNSSITNSSGSAKLYVTGTSSIAGSITTGRDYFDIANSLTVKNVTTGIDEAVTTEWGQYYAGAVTLTGTASLTSNDYNIGFNSTIQGNNDLTVNAGLGYVMFKNRVGVDPLLETSTTVLTLNTSGGNDYVAFGNRQYSAGTSYAASTLRTSSNLKSLTVTGNEIFIKADITTDYNQSYTGHVRIGDNGTNGLIRSLISLDPTISFYGRSIYYQAIENGADVYKYTDNKYTFDDESSAPTHTLVLKAKGYCYVGSSASCGVAGNIRKALDSNGLESATVLYNSWMPLLNFASDIKTMLFPSSTYNALTFNLNVLTIPQGINDGSRNTTESGTVSNKSAVSYQYSLRPRSSPVIANTSGTPPGARGFVAGSVGRVASSSDAKSITAFIPVRNNLSGDVVIGNVSASFIDNGSSGSPVSSPSSKTPSDCKAQNKAECK